MGIDYEYRSAQEEGSHAYLFPVVSSFLSGTPAGSTVLDFGCGNGSFLARLQGHGWKLIGSDFSLTGIEIARANFPGIDFYLADVSSESAGIPSGSVDVIISTEVIEHLYNPRGFLRNAAPTPCSSLAERLYCRPPTTVI